MSQTYRVIITREGDDWLAEVPELEGASTFASTLRRLREYIREVIILGDDLPDDAEVRTEVEYRIDDPAVQQAVGLHQQRERLDREAEDLRRQTTESIKALLVEGYSVRDTAEIIGITPGRVSQLANG